jgi:hypothetical protein
MKIKKLMVRFLIFVFSLIVIAGILSAIVSLYYKPILESIIGKALGAKVTIGSISLEIKQHRLQINDFKLGNPQGFGEDKLLAYVPRISADYDQKSLIVNKKLHFTLLEIYVKTMVAIKNKEGKLNVEQLAIFKENFQEIPLQIDRLLLSADHVIYKSADKQGLWHIQDFEVKIKNHVYEGLPTLEDITAKVISEMLGRTTIKGFKLLGAAALMGSFGGWSLIIPAQTARVMSQKSGYEAVFKAGYEEAYKASLEAAQELGKNIAQDKEKGIIQGYMNDANVTIKITRQEAKTIVSVSAKKYFFAQLNIAGGVLYEIAEKLNQD